MTRPYSDATLDALAAAPTLDLAATDPVPCEKCGKPMLVEHPHNHATDPNPLYDPMPFRPTTREGLVAVILQEFLGEVPPKIHVTYLPSHPEPVGVSQYSAEAAGWVTSEETVDVLDTGELGSPPWSPPFHNYVGSYEFWEGEVVRSDTGMQEKPWTRNLNGIRRWCAGKHRTRYEHEGRPLCYILIDLMVRSGYSIGQSAKAAGVTPDTADLLLFGHFDGGCDHGGRCPESAFGKWWTWVADDLNGRTMRRVKRPAA